MFKDRAYQFVDRLKWDINKNDQGLEVDEYDNPSAHYVLWVGPHGEHLGSMRLAPTISSNMIRDHFDGYFSLEASVSQTDWEVTRLCISPEAPKATLSAISAELVKGACLFGLENGVRSFVGLCFPAMLRIYRRLGWSPCVVERSHIDKSLIYAKWSVDFSTFVRLFGRTSNIATSTEMANEVLAA